LKTAANEAHQQMLGEKSLKTVALFYWQLLAFTPAMPFFVEPIQRQTGHAWRNVTTMSTQPPQNLEEYL
jgi:hypothetical protein